MLVFVHILSLLISQLTHLFSRSISSQMLDTPLVRSFERKLFNRWSFFFLLSFPHPSNPFPPFTDRGAVVAWESFVMLRKLAVTAITVSSSDPYIQIFVALLLLIISYGMQERVTPFKVTYMNNLEGLGLFSLIFTQITSIRAFQLAISLPHAVAPHPPSLFVFSLSRTCSVPLHR